MNAEGPVAEKFPENYPEAVRFMFSHAGPGLLLAILISALAARPMLGGISWRDAVIVLLFVGLRGFMEWGLHRYVFNAAPLPLLGVRLHNPISVMHGTHHANPRQAEALFFGWKGVLLVLFLSLLTLLLLFRDVGLAVSGLLAVVVNLLLYEWFHLVAHSSIAPSFPPFRAAVHNHRRHHFVDGDHSFGVTSILADRVLGTYRHS
ncbi:MAG: sterol desaturase family protein [Pseudomonadota bacterium]